MISLSNRPNLLLDLADDMKGPNQTSNSVILIGLKRDESEFLEKIKFPKDKSDDSKKLVTDILASTVDNLLEVKCTDKINEYEVPVGSSSEIISNEKSPEKEARPSSIFLFSTGFGNWAQADNRESDEISSEMDTSSDDDGSNADPLLSCSQDEDSQSDVSNLTNVAVSESFSVTDLSQMDGECDLTEDCEEKEDAKIISPLSESRMSSSSGSPPWFLSDTEQTESKEEDTKSPFKLKPCDITLEKIEAVPNKIKNSPQKAESSVSKTEEENKPDNRSKADIELVPVNPDSENSESEPDYVELDSDSEEEAESDQKSKGDIELVPVNPDSDDDDILELDIEGDDEEEYDVIKIREVPDSDKCKDCGLRGSLISLFNPGEGANQAEIVRDYRVSLVEWEEIKMKEVSYIVRNITIYDRHGHMVSVDQVIYFLDNCILPFCRFGYGLIFI